MESPNPKRLTLQAYISDQVASGKLSKTALLNARIDVLRDPEWAAALRAEVNQEADSDAMATAEAKILLLSSDVMTYVEPNDAQNKSDIDSKNQGACREESTQILK